MCLYYIHVVCTLFRIYIINMYWSSVPGRIMTRPYKKITEQPHIHTWCVHVCVFEWLMFRIRLCVYMTWHQQSVDPSCFSPNIPAFKMMTIHRRNDIIQIYYFLPLSGSQTKCGDWEKKDGEEKEWGKSSLVYHFFFAHETLKNASITI